jgi:hypothetical protein
LQVNGGVGRAIAAIGEHVACYLRAWGVGFDVDAFLANTSLEWDPAWRRGDAVRINRRGRSRVHEDAGVTILAGAGDAFRGQVAAVLAFLASHEAELSRLMRSPGVSRALLDFGVYWEDAEIAAMFFQFPLELVKAAAGLGLELELSVYDSREAATERQT